MLSFFSRTEPAKEQSAEVKVDAKVETEASKETKVESENKVDETKVDNDELKVVASYLPSRTHYKVDRHVKFNREVSTGDFVWKEETPKGVKVITPPDVIKIHLIGRNDKLGMTYSLMLVSDKNASSLVSFPGENGEVLCYYGFSVHQIPNYPKSATEGKTIGIQHQNILGFTKTGIFLFDSPPEPFHNEKMPAADTSVCFHFWNNLNPEEQYLNPEEQPDADTQDENEEENEEDKPEGKEMSVVQ
jgi:hypothetical protein